jgi:two-component system, cell cycle response regulator
MIALARGPRLALLVAQGVAAAALVAFAVQAGLGGVPLPLESFFENWVYAGILLLAAGVCLARALTIGDDRAAWAFLGAGILAWALGELSYSALFAARELPPLFSVSDVGWLAFYPLCYVALMLLLRTRLRSTLRSMWLDGLVGLLAVAAIGTALSIDVITRADAGDTATMIVDLAYITGDVVLVGMVVAVFAVCGWRPGGAWALIGAGLALGGVVDGVFLHEELTGANLGGSPVTALWPASALILSTAALVRSRPRDRVDLDGARVLVMPSILSAAALCVLLARAVAPVNEIALTLAAATLVAALVRLTLTFREHIGLLERSRHEALTDALSGLGNRRKLMLDLEEEAARATREDPRTLIIFDLDGFKNYNDCYGHQAGDVLLANLGRRLSLAAGSADTYRLGGDEFCVLLRGADDELGLAAAAGLGALRERSEVCDISASFGGVVVPHETADPTIALRIADARLYAYKGQGQRSSVSRQTGDALLRAVEAREPELREHLNDVANLALALGRKLGLGVEELDEVTRAAELHDVGKVAVPDFILQKTGPLEPEEWDEMRRHTIVGDRILSAAPALGPVAKLVRSSHERYDGEGYPDGLKGEEIPLGARIVAVCDAFNAMTSNRPYQRAITDNEALVEIRACAGRQFDPKVVGAFCLVVEERAAERAVSEPIHGSDATLVA